MQETILSTIWKEYIASHVKVPVKDLFHDENPRIECGWMRECDPVHEARTSFQRHVYGPDQVLVARCSYPNASALHIMFPVFNRLNLRLIFGVMTRGKFDQQGSTTIVANI